MKKKRKTDVGRFFFIFSSLILENISFALFFVLKKSAAKEAKNPDGLSLVLTWYKGANRSPTAPRRRNHAIGHDIQTLYVALVLRAGASKAEISSTRDKPSHEPPRVWLCQKTHATFGP
jgi:hypothetical protein